MSTELEKLAAEDREKLLRAPALVALLASISDDGEVSNSEKAESVKLAHLRTYTSKPILHNYYGQVDEVFEQYFDEELLKLPDEWEAKEAHLKERLENLDVVLNKVNDVYAEELITSLKSFARHVFKTNSSFLQHFVLPLLTVKLNNSFNPKIGNR